MSAAKSLKVLLSIACFSFVPVGLVTDFVGWRSSVAFAQEQNDSDADAAQPEPLLRVQGVLEPGDRVLPDDNTFYDEHSFEGRQGETVVIEMSSTDLDTYLILQAPTGRRIALNDDGGGTNSRIAIELPITGRYTILANAYAEGDQSGSYTLTLRAATVDELALAEADRLMQQGRQQQTNNQYQEALQSFQQALTLYREVGDRHNEGTVLTLIGWVYGVIGPYSEALNYHQQAVVIFQEVGDRRGEANAFLGLGWDYDGLGQYAESIESYQQALVIFREIGDRRNEGTTLGNIGSVYGVTGPYSEALNYHQQALAVHRETGNRAGEGTALNNIGIVYSNLGQYFTALDYYQQALVVNREASNHEGEGSNLGNIGSTYSNLGQYSQALEYHQQALSIFREISDRESEGIALEHIASVYQHLEQYSQSLDYYQQALTVLREIGYRAREGSTLQGIGQVYQLLEQYPQALNYYRQALAIHQEVGNRPNEGATLNAIGAVHREMGQYSRALEYHQQALGITREVGDLPFEATVFLSLGKLWSAQDQPELAIAFYKQSVNITEQIRSSNQALSPELQQSFTETIAVIYRQLADLLLQQDRIIEAQQVLDLLKVQELDNYLRDVRGTDSTTEGIPARPAEAAIQQTVDNSIDRLIALNRELAELEAIPADQRTPAQTERLNELSDQERALVDQFLTLFDEPAIRENVDRLRQTTGNQSIDLNDFRNLQEDLAKLPQNAALLYPFVLDDRIELILVTESGVPIRQTVSVERRDLNEAIRQFREALQNPNSDAIAPAQRLYRWLIEPLESALTAAEIQTVLYAPDGQLRYIPLAALHDGDRWLAERFEVNNITAVSLTSIDSQPSPDPVVLAGAVTQGRSITVGGETFTFNDLPFAGREVDALAEQMPNTRSLLNQNLTPAIATAVKDYSIVHLATHAAFVQGIPEQSFILLGDDGENGGYVTLNQIRSWDLTDVDLIVLSACETGVGDELGDGREILGLGYQMQRAGANAVIASLWSVNDGGTQVLMDMFYTALTNGYSKTEALQRAQQVLITGDLTAVGEPRGATITAISTRTGLPASVSNNLSHPYYWAPFILIGNGL
ncbi:tetratricopeptide repeat protein [Microcoleus sp. FACHB-1515]|uniref:CHAT domain-containing protein n=1 Tax=Cyanophyceae TaxID=3028117 RepID=UPI001688F878|nr:tetratricopeptide repeat protein [Microcoleus sp. FACHB-1515]MBD2091289.1 tetratricopeptide repeat protein [Microcoleus sp. FACHB-1515]